MFANDPDFKMVVAYLGEDDSIHLNPFSSQDKVIEFLNSRPHDDIVFFNPQTEGAFEMAQSMLSEIQSSLWQATDDLFEEEALSLVLAGSMMVEAGFVLSDLGGTDDGLWAKFMRVAIVPGSLVDISEKLSDLVPELVFDELSETVQFLKDKIHCAFTGYNEDVSSSSIQAVIKISQAPEKTEQEVLQMLTTIKDFGFDFVTPPRVWNSEEFRYEVAQP